jgi:hypothetical protein
MQVSLPHVSGNYMQRRGNELAMLLLLAAGSGQRRSTSPSDSA